MGYRDETTFSDELIAFLFSCRSNSIRKKILFEKVKRRNKVAVNTYYKNISRLKSRGIIEEKNDFFYLSNKGKIIHQNPYKKINEKPGKLNKILIIFDIPERKKKVREWIRRQLKGWDFEMVQKSVWIGDGPLPQGFMDRLKFLCVDRGVKVYKLRKV